MTRKVDIYLEKWSTFFLTSSWVAVQPVGVA